MKTILHCFVGRHCLKALCVLTLLLPASFVCAGDVPVSFPVDTSRQEQVDLLEKARHRARMDRLKESIQKSHKHSSSGLLSPRDRSFMRLTTLLMILLNWWIVKIAQHKNKVVETDSEDSPQTARPTATVADLGMRSQMILKLLLLAVVWGIGVALLVVGSQELVTCFSIRQSMVEQGLDPKSLLMEDVILSVIGLAIGTALQIVGVWYLFKVRTQLRRVNAETKDEGDGER